MVDSLRSLWAINDLNYSEYSLLSEIIDEQHVQRPNWWEHRKNRITMLFRTLLVGFVPVVMVYQLILVIFNLDDLPNFAQFASACLAMIGIGFGFYQWIDQQRERTLNTFFERLKITNSFLADHPRVMEKIPSIWPAFSGSEHVEGSEFAMYVYLEIDNLEFVLMRYELGHVSDLLFDRSLRMFKSRCESAEFKEIACALVNKAGYTDSLRNTVFHLCGELNMVQLDNAEYA